MDCLLSGIDAGSLVLPQVNGLGSTRESSITRGIHPSAETDLVVSYFRREELVCTHACFELVTNLNQEE